MSKFRKIFKAGIWGTILGVILGILFASKRGKETRENLSKRLKKIKKDGINQIKSAVKEEKNIKNKVKDNIAEIKESFKK